jgi:selenocysteine-specific elongation factor
MSPQQINITLGTAGHIDHGKTALVKSLTGCETDRLKEEKERGMSIDLGFAPCQIADMQVGIVDVPGHENFIKTMVAGASGMDGVILVVAADDGIMPQTREHLDILTLLGIRHGLVALTKIDRVGPERLDPMRADLAGFLRGTFLDGAPILPVSNVTGQGFDEFFEGLWALVKSIRPKRIDGVFRLPLDRAFSVQGYGTVVAGIPVCGSARTGDELVLLPQNLTGRIKRIEVYGRTSETVMAGQCAAINVSHWDPRAITRGDTISVPGYFSAEEWYVCKLRLLPRDQPSVGARLHLKNGSEVKFHTGTSEVNAVMYVLSEGELCGGGDWIIQVRTRTPVVAGPGDHFILRTLSPVQTVGGGMIVEAVPKRLKRSRPNVLEDLEERAAAVPDEARFVEYCVRSADASATNEAELGRRAKVPRGRLQELLAELVRQQKVIGLSGGLLIHRDTAATAAGQLVEIVGRFHRQSPESPGLTVEQLRQECHKEGGHSLPLKEGRHSCLPLDKAVLEGVVALLKRDGRLVEQNQRLALAGHRPTFRDEEAQSLEAIEAVFRQQAFSPPSVEELVQKTGTQQSTVEKLMKLLREHERLVWVGEGLLFHREAVDRARQLLVEHIRNEGRLESVQFKYLVNTTRKFALPLLDYFDRVGLLRRVGNTRYLKNPPVS